MNAHHTLKPGDLSPETGSPVNMNSGSTTMHGPVSSEWVLIDDLTGSPILFANEIARPEVVPVGGVVDVIVGMENRAQAILDFWDDDVCNSGEDLTAGYRYEITIDPSWAQAETFTHCLGIGSWGSNTTTHQRDFPAPSEEGSYSIDIEIVLAESRVGHSESFEIVFEEPSPGDSLRPDPDPTDPGSGDGDYDIELPGGGSTGFIAGVAAVFVLLLLFVAIS